MADRPIEDLQAGDNFRRELVRRADSYFSEPPLWHGWAIMDAFLAGIDYARDANRKREWQPIETAPSDIVVDFWLDWAPDCKALNPPLAIDNPERRFRGKKRCWGSNYTATHWMPLPEPPKDA
jgi:Protein of unknown function (DUF551)